MLPAAWAAWRVIRRIAFAYGRRAAMRCSARRRRAAATISMARVIFSMFLIEPIRFLTSRWEAISWSGAWSHGRGSWMPGADRAIDTVVKPRVDQAGGDPAPRDAARRPRGSCARPALRVRGLLLPRLLLVGVLVLGLAVGVGVGLGLGVVARVLALLGALRAALVGRLALLVEVVAEVVGELLDERLELLDGAVVPVALPDLVEQVGDLRVAALQQRVEVLGDPVDVDAVEVAVGGREDLQHLVLDRERAALLLVQRLHEALAARQRALGVGVEVGAELRE